MTEIPGYEKKIGNIMGCWNCVNSSNGDHATIRCNKYERKVSGSAICPAWEDWTLSLEKKPVTMDVSYCSSCGKTMTAKDGRIINYITNHAYCSMDCLLEKEGQ